MPAATLNHIKYTPQVIGSLTASNLMAAINTMLTSANDYAGNPIAKPLTVNTEGTAAVYFSFYEGISSVRGIIAGDGSTAATTMRSPDTSSSSTHVYIGCAKGSIGAYGTWNTSPVWSGATFSGYWRGLEINAAASATLYGWSSGETLWLTSYSPAIAGTRSVVFGSLWDPGTSSSPGGESNSTLSGMHVSGLDGSSWITNQAFLSIGFFDHGTSNGNKHTMAWDGGALSTSTSVTRDHIMITSGVNVRKNRAGDIFATPLGCRDNSSSIFIGRLREVYYSINATSGQVLQIGGVDQGYFAGGRGTGTEDVFLLKA